RLLGSAAQRRFTGIPQAGSGGGWMRRFAQALSLAAVVLVAVWPARAEVTRVSVGTDGTQGNSAVSEVALSADANVVAFTSSADNLVPGCGGTRLSPFIRDRAAGTLTCIVDAGGGDPASPAPSADGRFIAYRATVGGGATAPRIQTFV